MEKLENYLLISIPIIQGVDDKKVLRAVSIKTGDHDFIHTQSCINSGESLMAIANDLQTLPPESVLEIVEPLREIIKSAGIALSKVCR
jgi:SepF-like predicted cell division protein (DUF552 family)